MVTNLIKTLTGTSVCKHLPILQSSHKLRVSAGQLGNSGRSAWRLQRRPGAPEAGGLHAEEEKMAHEGLAQGTLKPLKGP